MSDDDGKDPLQGLVAQIINARELVINIGSNNGVEKGMKFAVLAETKMEVRDPNTGELLDTLDREKVRVEATEVRERITVCRTYRTKYIKGGTFAINEMLSGLTAPSRTEIETLKAMDHPEPLSSDESYVKIGDRVVEVANLE